MAYFSLAVLVSPDTTLQELLLPFHPGETIEKDGYSENPNSKWRHIRLVPEGVLTLDGKSVPYAKIKNIDWSGMKTKIMNEAVKRCDCFFDEMPENVRCFTLGITPDTTKKEYLDRIAGGPLFLTYAVITPDGEWHEKGNSTDWDHLYWNRFIENVSPETVLYVIECHV